MQRGGVLERWRFECSERRYRRMGVVSEEYVAISKRADLRLCRDGVVV